METCYNCNRAFMCPCVYQPANQRKICKRDTYPKSLTISGKIVHLCSADCVHYEPPKTTAPTEPKKLEIPQEAYNLYEKAKNSLLGAAPLPSPDQWMSTVTRKMKAAWRELDIKEKNELTDYMNFMYDLTSRKG